MVPVLLVVLDRVGLVHVPQENYAELVSQIGALITSVMYIQSRTVVKAAAAAATPDVTLPQAPPPPTCPTTGKPCNRP